MKIWLKKIMDTDTTKYLYNDRDQLLKEVLGSDTTEYSYDANGNTTQKLRNSTAINYSYDSENRLLEADSGGILLAKYEYDFDGNRIKRITLADTINFLIDPNQMLAQVIAEYDNLGNIIVSYLYGDDLISQKRNNIKSFYHYDGLGSTRVLTDVNGIITDTYIFYAFGELLAKTGTTINNYLFTGEQYDPNLGFYYLRARLYNPAIGRFLTIDPFDGTLYDPMSLHKYLYCSNNPANKTDLRGLTSFYSLITVALITSALITMFSSAVIPLIIKRELFSRERKTTEFYAYIYFGGGGGYEFLAMGGFDFVIGERHYGHIDYFDESLYSVIFIGGGLGGSLYGSSTPTNFTTDVRKDSGDFGGWGSIKINLEIYIGGGMCNGTITLPDGSLIDDIMAAAGIGVGANWCWAYFWFRHKIPREESLWPDYETNPF